MLYCGGAHSCQQPHILHDDLPWQCPGRPWARVLSQEYILVASHLAELHSFSALVLYKQLPAIPCVQTMPGLWSPLSTEPGFSPSLTVPRS